MALADPHERMQTAVIQAVAVGLLLGLQHEATEGLGIHELLFPVLEDHGLETVAGVDVADDLGGILELIFDEGQFFVIVGSLADGRYIHRRGWNCENNKSR